MTENKYSWLENIMQEMLTERLNTPQHKPMYFGDYKAKILTHIEAEKAEARIDELERFPTKGREKLPDPFTMQVFDANAYILGRIKELKEEA